MMVSIIFLDVSKFSAAVFRTISYALGNYPIKIRHLPYGQGLLKLKELELYKITFYFLLVIILIEVGMEVIFWNRDLKHLNFPVFGPNQILQHIIFAVKRITGLTSFPILQGPIEAGLSPT